ncbi:MAG: hypothetical protein KDA37_02980 [Planctomycetales bacterium]|nr:hypothetical protein [Planctomycetales bacterium]
MSLSGGTPDDSTPRPPGAARYKRFRAPRANGETLFDPPSGDLPDLVQENRSRAAGMAYQLLGTSLLDLRAQARQALRADAGLSPEHASLPLVVTGHQPELFHPGVWIKNFVAGSLAKQVGGWAVNLVIDSDLCRSPTVRVPSGTPASPLSETVAYDALERPVPYEERSVVDAELFASFPERVGGKTRGLLKPPLLLDEIWPSATTIAAAGGSLAEAITGARHAVELAWGNQTWEMPISRVCDSAGFACFAIDILARLPDFQRAHNAALAEYRAAHRLRSPAQPLPDLHQREDWLEAPLWCWTAADPTRRPLYARQTGRMLELSDLAGQPWRIDLAKEPVGQLADLRLKGLKVRSRALVTTLYARLVLADLFIHGIGGAKYDEAADHLAERFYGFSPPQYATVSATLRLPIEYERATPQDLTRVDQRLREMRHHPERRLQNTPEAQPLIAEKRAWVDTEKTKANCHERHLAITSANAAMQRLLAPQRESLLETRSRLRGLVQASRVLDSREYAYCLFPAERLRRLLDIKR